MRKIHLRRNKAEGDNKPIALCSTNPLRPMIKGTPVPYNSRSTYRGMTSEAVPLPEFRKVAPAGRCAHCVDMATAWRNQVRGRKGLPPVTSWEEA